MLRKQVEISDKLSIGPQPAEADIKRIAGEGFSTIVNLATEGEIDQKLTLEHARELSEDASLAYHSLAISPTSMKIEHLKELTEIISKSSGPVYLHCGMGQRAVPFALAYFGVENKVGFNDLMKYASDLDIEPQVPALQNFIKNCLHEVGLQII